MESDSSFAKIRIILYIWWYIGIEVLTVVAMKSSIFWDIACSAPKVNRHFEGTCHLHLHGQRISQAQKQCESRWQANQPACKILNYIGSRREMEDSKSVPVGLPVG
jgi:hypothetical protein